MEVLPELLGLHDYPWPMKFHYDDIASASPKDLRRLLEWLKAQSPVGANNSAELPAPGDTAGLIRDVCKGLGVFAGVWRHTCRFEPIGGMGDYSICWGCGEVADKG